MGRSVFLTVPPKMWDIRTDYYKNTENLNAFKIKNKICKPNNDLCRLCSKGHIDGVAFLLKKV